MRKIAGWDGPNRAGKSTAAAMLCAEMLTGWPIEGWSALPIDVRGLTLGAPRHVGCVTVGMGKSIEGQQKAIADLLPRSLLACKPWSERTGFGGEQPRCVLRNQSQVTFLSDEMRAERFEQFAFDLVWIDEAVKQWVYDRLIARLIDTAGKFMITAVAEAAWIYRVLRMRVMRHDSLEPVGTELVDTISDSTIWSNELLDEGAIADSLALWGGMESREARMRAQGQYVHLSGVVFPEFDNIENVEATRTPERGWTYYEWLDPGYRNPFAVVFAACSPDGVIHLYDEIYVRGQRVPAVAALIKEKRRLYKYTEPQRCLIDEAADQQQHRGVPLPSYRQELIDCGIRTISARHPPGSVDAGNQKVAVLLGRRALRVQQHLQWTRFEFMNYKHEEPDAETGEFLRDNEKPIDAHNHAIAAIRYGVSDGPIWMPIAAAEPPRNTVAHDLWSAGREDAAKRSTPWD